MPPPRLSTLYLVTTLLLLPGIPPPISQAQPLPLGAPLPMQENAFRDATTGAQARLADLTGRVGTVIVFYCNRCLWVDKYEDRLMALAERYAARGIRFILVNANDPVSFPLDSYEESRARARKNHYEVPYLMDKKAELADALGAERTPQVYVFDGDRALVYVGAIDDCPMDARKVQQAYLRDALEALTQGTKITVPETKPFGCSLRCLITGS